MPPPVFDLRVCNNWKKIAHSREMTVHGSPVSRRTDSFCDNGLSQDGSRANSLGRWSVFRHLICKGQVHSLLFVIGIMSPSGAGGRSFATHHKRLGVPKRGTGPLGHKPRMCCITCVGLGGQGG